MILSRKPYIFQTLHVGKKKEKGRVKGGGGVPRVQLLFSTIRESHISIYGPDIDATTGKTNRETLEAQRRPF